MPFADSEGIQIYYDDRGEGEAVLLCLPGRCNDHTIFAPLAERLSADHRVLAMDWRGHGNSQASDRDFGFAENAVDALTVIQACGAQSVIPIAQGQAPWVAIELRRRLGERVPKIVATSWPVISTSGNPLASRFLDAIQALQYYERWREGAEQLLTMWLSGAPASVETQIRNQMLRQGFEMWSRAGREITAMYAREGDPLQALSKVSPPVPVLWRSRIGKELYDADATKPPLPHKAHAPRFPGDGPAAHARVDCRGVLALLCRTFRTEGCATLI
jgi:pimeloyl-ACP methyl ester carboxylesterase